MSKVNMDISRIRRISDNLLSAYDTLALTQKNKQSTADLKEDAYYLKQLIGDALPNTNLVKRVYCLISNNCFGTVGDYTGYKDYHVGDVVSFNYGTKGMIVEKNGIYFVYGWLGKSLMAMESDGLNFCKLYKYNEYNINDVHINSPVTIRNEFL